MTEGDRQPVSFCSVVSFCFTLSHLRDWDLVFFPVSWEYRVGLYRLACRCVRPFLLHAVQLAPLAFAFTIFGVLFVLALLVLCCFLAWMKTAILAEGIAVVRSGFCVVC